MLFPKRVVWLLRNDLVILRSHNMYRVEYRVHNIFRSFQRRHKLYPSWERFWIHAEAFNMVMTTAS